MLATRNGRFLTFGILYVSEGIPYGFTSVAMVTFMRQQGMALDLIGIFFSALLLPWALKWAWAPLIDLVKLNRLGGRKGWIMICTVMMILTLAAAAMVDFTEHFRLLLAMIVLNNLFCATQDVAIDSLAVSSLKPNERGRGNGFMFAGQYFGIALGGGAAVFVYGLYGFEISLAYVCLLLVINLLFVVFFVHDKRSDLLSVRHAHFLRKLASSMIAFVKEVYISFWKSGTGPMVGVVFSLLPVGAMALAYATLGTIQVDYGLQDGQIAELRIYNTIATALGCVLGGLAGDRFGTRRTVAVSYVLTTLPTLVLALQISSVGLQSVSLLLFYTLTIAHGLFFGMAYGVRNAIFMGMTNPAVAATQFTAFMAMSNLAISIGNFWQGMVAEKFDYATVFYLDSAIVLLVVLVIPFLHDREESAAREAAKKGAPVPESAVLENARSPG